MPQLTLEERVDRLESIDAIKRLKAVYCMYCDAKYDAEGICSLFIEDGVWDGGPSFGRYEGHRQIRSFFERISGDILFAAHLVLNPIITVEGDRAHGRWWLHMPCTALNDVGTAEGRWLLSEYDEEYVRIDGTWKFKTLRLAARSGLGAGVDWQSSLVIVPALVGKQPGFRILLSPVITLLDRAAVQVTAVCQTVTNPMQSWYVTSIGVHLWPCQFFACECESGTKIRASMR
jgi:hypothetical protein